MAALRSGATHRSMTENNVATEKLIARYIAPAHRKTSTARKLSEISLGATPVTSINVIVLAKEVALIMIIISLPYAGSAWRNPSGAIIRQWSVRPDIPNARAASIAPAGT